MRAHGSVQGPGTQRWGSENWAGRRIMTGGSAGKLPHPVGSSAPLFARLPPSHCHRPGFPCTLPARHHLASPCSQSCHTMQTAFPMKCISSKQPGAHTFGPCLFPAALLKNFNPIRKCPVAQRWHLAPLPILPACLTLFLPSSPGGL